MSICVLFSFATVCGWAYEDDQEKKTISGIVVDMDWVKNMITVSYCDPLSGNSDELDIVVPNDTKITRGAEDISLGDIEQSDPVTVVYYDDGLSGLKAKRVTDLNLAQL
jgi:hypothetical protein